MSAEAQSEGKWPGGWLVALAAGVLAAILARWLGGVEMTTAVLVGIFTFLVFGVLLGMYWEPPAQGGHGDHGHGHGHGDHGHGHSHDDHGHDHPAPAPAVAPAPEPAPAPVVAAPAPAPAPEPAPVAAPAAAAVGEAKPQGLVAPRDGKGDNLQVLEGIGPGLEKLCHELGIFHYDQIASWGAAEVAWMDGNLKGFKGRVTRDKWVAQAKLIGQVGIEEFKRRAKTNDY